jgi:PAS domain S-box-containing protein
MTEDTYRLAFKLSMTPMLIMDAVTTKFIDVNDAWTELYGYTRDEACVLLADDVRAEPPSTSISDLVDGMRATIVTRHRKKDGTIFPVEAIAGRLKHDGRDVIHASIRDLTQELATQTALARSEASFQMLIESMPTGVLVHQRGRAVYMNPEFRRMFGYALAEDIKSVAILDFVEPSLRDRVRERVAAVTKDGHVPLLEERLLRRDGTIFTAEVTGIRIILDDEPAVLAIVRDVTARKESESRLVMNDRLASLGRLAASVGHELNNPLAYQIVNLSLLKRELAKAGPLDTAALERCLEFVRIIGEGAMRMRTIVHDLKTLARADSEERVPIDVQSVLDVCANMIELDLSSRARLVKDYRARAFVQAPEARLGQVFLNLLVNAVDSIPSGDVCANEVKIVLEQRSDRVIVEICDTGIGVAEKDRDRIFEPFFTTKEGTGTGLGLSISHGIVTGLGGTIAVEPRNGAGSVFRVELPAA